MRADRLVAILLMLQRHGRVTAAAVAAELEISERTARRDLDALAQAGMPVVSTRGRNGGWELVGGGRTDLSGLSEHEVRALFLLAGPAPATPELRAALRKLVRALPEPLRDRAERAANAVVVDPTEWGGGTPGPRADEPPQLLAVQELVVAGREGELDYVDRTKATTRRRVAPLGLAQKGRHWYLLADTDAGLRTFRLDRVVAVRPLPTAVTIPEGFDLGEAWAAVRDRVEELRDPVVAALRIAPERVGLVRHVFGVRLELGARERDGRVGARLRGPGIEALAGQLGGFGDSIEVTAPESLRTRLAEIGAELLARYSPR